jgi:alpha-1,2-mannosyltransferase
MTQAAAQRLGRAARRVTSSQYCGFVPVVLGAFSVGGALAFSVAAATGHQIDFDVYRMAAGHVFGSDLYTVRLQRSLMGHDHIGLHFTYPPFAALLFWPFTRLSVPAAQLVWSVLNIGALFALICVSVRAARPAWPARTAIALAACVLLPVLLLDPDRLTVGLGQVNCLVALLALTDMTCTVRAGQRTLPRGVLLGLAAAIKLTPLIFVPFLLLTRQFRAAGTAALAFLICSAGMFAIAPRSSAQYWTSEVFDSRRAGNLVYVSDQNLHSALQRFIGSPPAPLLLGALTVLLSCGGLAVARWAYRASSPLLGIIVCAATGLIVSPVSWIHHYVWVVPALAWLVLGADRPRGGSWWALGLAALCWAAPAWWVPDQQQPYGGPVILLEGNSFFLAALGFVVLAAVLLSARARRPRPLTSDRTELHADTDQRGALLAVGLPSISRSGRHPAAG